jgi:hypothetical protein
MSDAVKLTPPLPTVPPLPPTAQARPDLRVEPPAETRPEPRTADNGNGRDRRTPEAPPERGLQISRDQQTGTVVYRAIDTQTSEVIWQYPPDSRLRMAEQLERMRAQQERAAERKVDERG